MNITNTGTAPKFLLDRQTVDETTSVPFQNLGSHKDFTVTYTSEGTTSSGNMIIEESDLPSYTGTWSQLHSQTAAAVSGNAKLCVHVQIGAGMWTRVRINTAIAGGGTMTATISSA
jgi:hypothetical protein